jgi:Squalene-hopene cyclase C-terminal domain
MPLRFVLTLLLAWIVAVGSAVAEEPGVTQAALRAAVEKSLPLLMAGAVGHRENRTCFACHQQGPPILALTAARDRGFSVDEKELAEQTSFIAKFLDGNRENYLQGKGTGGQADTAGYALWTLAAVGRPHDATTDAVAEYLLLRHKDRDHWLSTSNRPPSEAGSLTTTYIALYGLTSFGTEPQKERIAARIEQVREWIVKEPAKDNEDRVFRLLGLQAAGAPPDRIAAAAAELLSKQRSDGGWAQLDSGEPAGALESDAYATGSALVALHEAGGVATSDPAYQKGLVYLLNTQLDDGSWKVVSRSKPFQPYYESGFPHGKDQFISCAASAWATWAMVLTQESGARSQESGGK